MLFLCLLAASALSAQDGAPGGATHADWPHHGGTQMSWRYSALDQINITDVRSLTPAWMFQPGDYGDNLQATPIVIDGVMYISTPYGQVFALDAASGRCIWQNKYVPARTFARPGSQSVGRTARSVIFYDLTLPPPVLRTADPAGVKTAEGSTWRHLPAIDSYSDADLESILIYLRNARQEQE
jgi:hypothetical protein